MNAAAQILKNFNLYVDGRGYAGNVDEVSLPILNIVGEDYRAGGMDAPIEIDMGMEKLEATFKVSKFDRDLIAKWGVAVGGTIPLVLRGALESLDGTVQAVVVKLTGRIHSMEVDTVTPGAKAAMTFRFAATAYSYQQDGETLIDIDVRNMKRIIGGVDRLAAQRKAIGL
jgi:P2 family phage contractile tail tube protein